MWRPFLWAFMRAYRLSRRKRSSCNGSQIEYNNLAFRKVNTIRKGNGRCQSSHPVYPRKLLLRLCAKRNRKKRSKRLPSSKQKWKNADASRRCAMLRRPNAISQPARRSEQDESRPIFSVGSRRSSDLRLKTIILNQFCDQHTGCETEPKVSRARGGVAGLAMVCPASLGVIRCPTGETIPKVQNVMLAREHAIAPYVAARDN